MVAEHILRIARSDSEGDFVLIKVMKRGASGLDLKFVATEGENPYVGSLKSSQINKLRAKNYRGTDDEWSEILSYIFAQDESFKVSSEDWISGVEVVAAVKSEDEDESGNEIVITLRKRIDSITQRLGAVTLKQDDDQAIQLFDWTGTAVNRADHLSQEISSLKTKYKSAEDTINQLNSQLEELIEAKNEHDDQLIAKFGKLLNEKKLKIRNQQRLLSTANVDNAKLAQLEAANADNQPRKPDNSRRTKRKAEEEAPASESEDAFDTMDVDNKVDNNANKAEDEATESEGDRRSTPEPLEDETASEDEEENAARPPPKNKSSIPPGRNGEESTPPAANPSAPPPRRELPFAKRTGRANAAPASTEPEKPENDNADTTDSDDEL